MFLLFVFFACSLSAQITTNAPATLAPPYGEIPPTFWEQHGILILAVGAAFLVLAAVILWKLLQPKPAAIRSPEMVAREALTKLLRQPETGRLLSEVSQIVRRYVIAVFGLPVAELTTTEFCAALAASEKTGGEIAGVVSSFLRECDERKFSPAGSSAPLNAAARALEILALAEKVRDRHDACPTEK